MINVKKTFLPPLKDYIKHLETIWETHQTTNNGPLLQKLEQELKIFLGVKNLVMVCNGTIALQIAIKSLNLSGEIITTPFSYVATTSSIVWENCSPVFVDIDPQTLCINPALIEQAITENTTAILATHVFGFPCEVDAIRKIAQKHKLKVIYDAAHAFHVQYNGDSILNHGDISILSFHATKLFHTVEGGALITNDEKLTEKFRYMRNFGHKGYEEFQGLGINGKSSEFCAAMGLCVLPFVPEMIGQNMQLSLLYKSLLSSSNLEIPEAAPGTKLNFSYFPVLFPSEANLLMAVEKLKEYDIHPRRYFYPSLSQLPYVNSIKMENAENIAARVLCLPLYNSLTESDVKQICEIITKSENV